MRAARADLANVRAPGTCRTPIHPDQHQIVVNPSNPTQIFEGSDGGVIRTDGTFADTSCRCNSNERGPLGSASLANCARMLSRVPNRIEHTTRTWNTLQFIDVAINPAQSCEVQGGTQDNGTWSNPAATRTRRPQIIYGDGGNSGYDGTNPTWRFNQFTSAFSDSNFENGDPTKWVISSAPIVNSGEAVALLLPAGRRPEPAHRGAPDLRGGPARLADLGLRGGTPGAVPQDKNPNIAFYEANCPEFTVFGGDPNCGDYQPMGGAAVPTRRTTERRPAT